MENDIEYNKRKNNRLTLGILLLAIGVIYLLNQLTFYTLPFWLFSWPMWLIVFGLASGVKHNFQRPGAFVMILIGGIFLANMASGYHFLIFWPVVLIALGIRMVFFRDSKLCRNRWEQHGFNQPNVHTDHRDTI